MLLALCFWAIVCIACFLFRFLRPEQFRILNWLAAAVAVAMTLCWALLLRGFGADPWLAGIVQTIGLVGIVLAWGPIVSLLVGEFAGAVLVGLIESLETEDREQ